MKASMRVGSQFSVAALLVWLGVSLSGCVPGGSVNHGPARTTKLDKAPLGADVIQVGDHITVTPSDIPKSWPPMEQPVQEDGKISLWDNFSTNVTNMTTGHLEKVIHDYYVPNYFQRMTVSVSLEHRFFTVGGWVRSPNRYQYAGQMTLVRAIQVAGGFSQFGKQTDVQVTRSDGTVVKVNYKKALKNPTKYDVPIYPGDSIWVSQRHF